MLNIVYIFILEGIITSMEYRLYFVCNSHEVEDEYTFIMNLRDLYLSHF